MEALPETVLLKMFKHLDEESLNNALYTCVT